jgi:hypothetical protein
MIEGGSRTRFDSVVPRNDKVWSRIKYHSIYRTWTTSAKNEPVYKISVSQTSAKSLHFVLDTSNASFIARACSGENSEQIHSSPSARSGHGCHA